MKAKKVTVAWECPSCGHQHLWKWSADDAEFVQEMAEVWMGCDKCEQSTVTDLFRIGRNVWSCIYRAKA